MEGEIENSIQLVTQGFLHHEDRIKHLLRGYSFLNTPVIGVKDIGNCFDSLEDILSVRLVPVSFIKGETGSAKVLPFQKQQFYQSLEYLASKYRGQKSVDLNGFRDIIIDYLSIEGDQQLAQKLGYHHKVEFVLKSTIKKSPSFGEKLNGLGPTHPGETTPHNEEDELQIMINEAQMSGDEEKLALLQDLYTLNTEFSISVDNEEKIKIKRKIEMLKKRIKDEKSRTPSQGVVRRRVNYTPQTVERQNNKDLQEIFDFYSKQHIMIGKRSTFDNIKQQNSILNMGDFILFCKDFKVPLDRRR